MVKKQSKLPLNDSKNKDTNIGIEQQASDYSISLRDLHKELELTNRFDDWVKTSLFSDNLAVRFFRNAKKPRLEKSGKVNGYMNDYLLTAEQANLIKLATNKELQVQATNTLTKLDDRMKDSVGRMQLVQEILQIEIAERDARLAIAEKQLVIAQPALELQQAREANLENKWNLRDCLKRLKGEAGDISINIKGWLRPLKVLKEDDFKIWLHDNSFTYYGGCKALQSAIIKDYCHMIETNDKKDKSKVKIELFFTERGYNAMLRAIKKGK